MHSVSTLSLFALLALAMHGADATLLPRGAETGPVSGSGSASGGTVAGSAAQYQWDALNAANAFVTRNGKPAMCLQPALNQAAQEQAQYMASTGKLTHTGSGGSQPWDRMKKYGYTHWGAAENVAYGGVSLGYDQPAAPEKAWENSAGHRANLLGGYKHFGVGKATGPCPGMPSAQCVWWVQDFANPGASNLGCLAPPSSSGSGNPVAAPAPAVTQQSAPVTTPTVGTPQTQTTYQRQLVNLANAYRSNNGGAGALCLNAKLMAAAQKQANDMAAMNKLSHTGSDGSNPFQRISAAGYPSSAQAEIIASGPTSGYDTPASALGVWINSAPHRQILVNGVYTQAGVAKAVSGSTTYWSMTFGNAKEPCM
ncbi:hypothetical protein AMAG_16162 [Allomyces macrogynus ATCC 38327]|uniref:SCP domain-containing protein n=1 Tax=Allomyces macrogynus (strain ATCC 38327) TaxID=578462 RepID=A0A0L0TA74_ALLM3|nr:hypothetical protein AMAG_16162 [Allomyces macrogynus ATCC 38327]|eukprot:KNE71600.1 hypothetical protein AMAG_16162 [Allomyces macrogynus ATCC 38327]